MNTIDNSIKGVKIVHTRRGAVNAEFYEGYAFHATRAYYNPLFCEWYFDWRGARYFISNSGQLVKSVIINTI